MIALNSDIRKRKVSNPFYLRLYVEKLENVKKIKHKKWKK